jgi:hypothetical protein
VELDFEEEERLDAEENTELNRGLLEGNSTRRHS